MKINVNDIQITQRKRRLDIAKVAELASSILELGLINPITVSQGNGTYKLVAGLHRLEACKVIQWTEIPATLFEGDALDAELAEIDENLRRADLTILEQGEALLDRERVLIKRGERAHNKMGRDRGSNIDHLKTTEEIAKEVGMGKSTAKNSTRIARDVCEQTRDNIRDNEDVADNQSQLLMLAKMPEEAQIDISERIKSGEAKSVTDARTQKHKDDIHDIEPPTGKYQVIYVDPPWSYGQALENYGPASRHYATMTTEDIKAMRPQIDEIAMDNSALFIWTTSPKIQEGLDVASAWGFTYKAMFIWDKVKHNFGHYNSVRHELLLLCTKGSYPLENQELFDSVQTIERNDEHSEKPHEFRTIIEKIYPSAKKIELFARKEVSGWNVWGNLQ